MPEFSREHTKGGATLIYDTGERADDALSRLAWMVPGAFIASSLILFFAITEWFSPALPILLFAALVWLPAAGLLIWKKHHRGLRPVMMALLLLATFGLPLMAWNIPAYRAAALWVVAELTPFEPAMAAADDGADLVASIACEEVLAANRIGRTERMRSVLEQRPEMAVRCLKNIEEDAQTSAIHLARHLRETWYNGWMGEEALDEELGCRGAEQFAALGKLYDDRGTPELLMCALGSPNPTFSTCCAEALSAGSDEAKIHDVRPDHWRQGLDEPLFVELTAAVDLPAHTLMAADPVNESLQWTPADLFHWTTHLGCHMLSHNERPEAIARQLSSTMDTQCGLDVDDPLFSFAAVRFVERTCAGVDSGDGTRVDVVEWCDVAREANRDTVVDAAKFLVMRATGAHDVQQFYDKVAFGGELADQHKLREKLFPDNERARRKFDESVGTKGLRVHRPSWKDHTPEARQGLERRRQEDIDRTIDARRQLEQQDPMHRPSADELDREVSRRATEQARQELEEARRQGMTGGDD